MDALKLRLRAKDQLHPILQELVTGYARFKGSKDWEGRSRMVGWWAPSCSFILIVLVNLFAIVFIRLITLNGMKASEELTEEQSRQVCASPCFIILLAHMVLISVTHNNQHPASFRRRLCICRVFPEFGWEQGWVVNGVFPIQRTCIPTDVRSYSSRDGNMRRSRAVFVNVRP